MTTSNQKPIRSKISPNNSINGPSILFWVYFIALFLQLPAGYIHLALGKFAYIKDIFSLFAFGLVIATGFRARRNVFRLNILFWISLFVLFTYLTFCSIWSGLSVNIVIIYKWIMLWIIALFCGHHFKYLSIRQKKAILFILAVYSIIEISIGLWEIRNQRFYFAADTVEQTLAGIDVARMNTLDGSVRVKGLQRSVFQFSNNMSMISVAALYFGIFKRNYLLKSLYFSGALGALYCCYMSGGRTGLIGTVFGIFALASGYILIKLKLRNICYYILIALGLSALIITLIGPANVFKVFTGNTAILLESSYIREEYWAGLTSNITNSFSWFYFGSMINFHGVGHTAPIAITDNQFIWFFYHLGIIGTFPVLIPFLYQLKNNISGQTAPRSALLILALSSITFGESVGRDSIFLMSFIVLIAIVGYSSNTIKTKS